jgi:hypothetical protein
MMKNKEQSLWFKMLESKILSKLDRSGNVFVFGDPLSGKKKLIQSIQEYAKNKAYDRRKNFDGTHDRPDLDNVYIMDFKYLSAKQSRDDDVEEIGKINFYIFNKKYEFIKDFLTRDMFHNMLVVIVLDLESPQTIQESFSRWYEFAQKSIFSYIVDLPEETQAELKANFIETNKKLKDFGVFAFDPKVKADKPKQVIREDPLEDEPEEVAEIGHIEEEAFGLPLVIVGNKSDTVESLNGETLKDYVDYTLRQINIENHGTLFTASAKNDWNLNLITQFLLSTLLDKTPDEHVDLKDNFNIMNMHIKSGSDSMEKLKEAFPNHEPLAFQAPTPVLKRDITVEHSDVKNINDFLADLNTGVFSVVAESEDSSIYRSTNFATISGISGINQRPGFDATNQSSRINTQRIRNIINRPQ